MDDKTLLNFAARAAGYPPEWRGSVKIICDSPVYERAWNPLEDDGDALRLAVKLQIDVVVWDDKSRAQFGDTAMVDEPCVGDSYAATRRAIVRAAAEIGKLK